MKISPVVILLAGLLGCYADTQSPAERHVFVFEHGGETYVIISSIPGAGEGSNFLVHRGDEGILWRARDYGMDGSLDTVLIGDISLVAADRIYKAGINEAMSAGKVISHNPIRLYELKRGDATYTIRTYIIDGERVFNRFQVVDRQWQEGITLIDRDADGLLDNTESADAEHTLVIDAQPLYRMVLESGIRAGRIESTGRMFLVKESD